MKETVTERKRVKVSRETLEVLLRSPNLRKVMKSIEGTAMGSKVRVMCKDTLNHSSYVIPGRITEIKPNGIVVHGSFIPYKIIQLYEKN